MITKTFYVAAAYNFCIIFFSKGFSSNLAAIDPLFSPTGCLCILLWGAAYFALAKGYQKLPQMALVFCVEKAVYGIHWALWMAAHHTELPAMFEADPLIGLFYAIYGVGDLAFMVFFGWVFWKYHRPLD